ncbi:fibrous sheath-interacting protein 2 isoform X2 [Athene cunicularia]|uniref:fibrous sheath-interacting protein 2 isoform X2 n=1 Tax=Athene cunicularia TaxID=194338 RepID=UPI000EF64E06|nr:fibrous sheath-interacting protein 2 isoform X2 [Athene cunicularia]
MRELPKPNSDQESKTIKKAGHRSQHPGEGATGLTDRELLDLPLGAKIPVLPGSRPVFSRAKLGEKLQLPSGHFDLGDPYCRLLRREYNSLHDPSLKAYHNRRHNFRRLREAGLVTSDGQVICTLKEFNEYRQYLLTLRVQAENVARQEEEKLRQHLARFKAAPKLATARDTSRLAQRPLQPRKPSCPPPPKGRKGRLCARVKGPLHKGQTCPKAELRQESAKLSQRLSSDVVPEVLGTGNKSETDVKPNPRTSAKGLAIRALAKDIVENVLDRACQRGPALTPELQSGRGVSKPPTPQDGKESHPAADALPSTVLQFSRQPVPPAGPNPPAHTGARRPLLRIKLPHSQPGRPV